MSMSEGNRELRRSKAVGIVCVVLFFVANVCGVVLGAEAADPNGTTDSRRNGDRIAEAKLGPVEIHTGFVIGDKGYIAPPYVVRSVDEVVYVNDQAVLAWPWRRGFRPRRSRGNDSIRDGQSRPPGNDQGHASRDGEEGADPNGRGGMPPRGPLGPPRGMPMTRQVARIERHLRDDGMLICVEGTPAAMIPLRQAIDILDVLISRQSSELKVQSLMDMNVAWMASEQWGAVVDKLDPSDELLLRLKKARAHCAEEESRRIKADHQYLRLHSIVTILGFLLAVWAFGSLFSCRRAIPDGVSSREFSGISPEQVVRLIVLVAILSAYDLVCTLFANGLGGLWELNPLAGSLLSSQISIVTFKVVLTAGACTLLAIARHHRFAQVAAWWAGVLYTMLILRWATFNSVFIQG